MGVMVYALFWAMQDIYHHQEEPILASVIHCYTPDAHDERQ